MTIGTFDTAVLNRIVESLDRPSSFLLDVFFPEEQTEDSQEIHFDYSNSKPRITPFVSPLKAGKIVQSEGFTTKSFKPAYAKDKRIFQPNQPLKRAIGEQLGGRLTPQQRRDLALLRAMEDQLACLTRREEVMASEALRLGQVTVAGDDYPEVVVDYDRDTDHTVALTTTARWGETGVSPLEDLESWVDTIHDTSGASATVAVMDPKAWALFRADEAVKDLLNTRRGSASSGETGIIARAQGNEKARYAVTVGTVDVWVYQDTYIDDDGNSAKMMPDHSVIVGSPAQTEGVRAYGAIQDEEASYAAERYFAKSWLEKDPALRYLLLQSAPLVVPYRPNATLGATVR